MGLLSSGNGEVRGIYPRICRVRKGKSGLIGLPAVERQGESSDVLVLSRGGEPECQSIADIGLLLLLNKRPAATSPSVRCGQVLRLRFPDSKGSLLSSSDSKNGRDRGSCIRARDSSAVLLLPPGWFPSLKGVLELALPSMWSISPHGKDCGSLSLSGLHSPVRARAPRSCRELFPRLWTISSRTSAKLPNFAVNPVCISTATGPSLGASLGRAAAAARTSWLKSFCIVSASTALTRGIHCSDLLNHGTIAFGENAFHPIEKRLIWAWNLDRNIKPLHGVHNLKPDILVQVRTQVSPPAPESLRATPIRATCNNSCSNLPSFSFLQGF